MKIEKMYSTGEASKILACSVRTIYRMIDKGLNTKGREGLSPIAKRESGVIMIPSSTIEDYVERTKCVH